MSRAGQPGGRFDARYEAHSVSAGARDDLEGPFGQIVDWWAYDVAHQQVDPIYDVGVPEVGGRVWKGPYRLPVISAHQIQGKTPQQNHEGFFNADRLRLVVRVDTARQVGLKHIASHPDQLLADRVQWRGQVYKPEGMQPRGIVGHDRYLIVSIDATQVRSDELINDPSFDRYWNELPVSSGSVHLYAGSALRQVTRSSAGPPTVWMPAQASLHASGGTLVPPSAHLTVGSVLQVSGTVVPVSPSGSGAFPGASLFPGPTTYPGDGQAVPFPTVSAYPSTDVYPGA